MNRFHIILIFTILFCCSFTLSYHPSRPPYDGFKWKKFNGAGLSLFVQENQNIKFSSSESEIFIEHKNSNAKNSVIKVFYLNTNDIDELKTKLNSKKINSHNAWDNLSNCEFKTIKKNTKTTKYILVPKGKALKDMQIKGQKEPIPYTCNNYGVGNSGFRYFETQKNRPLRVIFVEIGQDAPLFDEQSIKIR